MERQLLRPRELSASHGSPESEKAFKFWLRTVEDFIAGLSELRAEGQPPINRKRIIISCLSAEVYPLVEESETYDDIVRVLRNIYVKRRNNVFARHLLVSRRQRINESVADYLQTLRELAKDCTFTNVTAVEFRDQMIRDSFINGLSSPLIRQRLLENEDLSLERAFELAETLNQAELQSNSLGTLPSQASSSHLSSAPVKERNFVELDINRTSTAEVMSTTKVSKCYFCGGFGHFKRNACPAKNVICFNCGKRGHFAKVCKNKSYIRNPSLSAAAVPRILPTHSEDVTKNHDNSFLAPILAGAPSCLGPSLVKATIQGKELTALVDSGASENFIDSKTAAELKLPIQAFSTQILMASENCTAKTLGTVSTTLNVLDRDYTLDFRTIDKLCSDVILGLPFLKCHREVSFVMNGPTAPLKIYNQNTYLSVAVAKVSPPTLFEFLTEDCKPVATKSRRYCEDDQKFISQEIKRLLEADIIEPSRSPWRAQVLVVKQSNKKRLVIDYSATVNRFTQLDAYPLPRMETIVNKIAQDKFYSSIDLRSAYHQIPIKEKERILTSFEADGCLYQYKRLPFGVVNGVAAFQRVIDNFVKRHNLKKVYAYLDDITVTGFTEEEHDRNLQLLLDAAKTDNLTLNQEKSKIKVTTLNLLGYQISHGEIKPDSRRLQPLLDLPPPQTQKELKRVCGLFAYYARWIEDFSRKAFPLQRATSFPLETNALQAFEKLKADLSQASLGAIRDDLPFEVATDASNFSIAAILSQGGKPVAYLSRTLSASEKNYPAVEKEAAAIMESIRKWEHFLYEASRRN